nr:uncharacterized protein LOC113729143 [Coffea arabica]
MAGLQPPGGGLGRSFAAVLQQQPTPSPCKVKPAAQFKGEPAVMFSEEDIAKLAAPFQFAVVGKFSHGRPNLDAIRKSFTTIGFTSSFTVGLLNQRHILIRFCLEEDYLRCWTKGWWSIADFPMRTFKWTPEFKVTSESTHAPVWVALEHLPIHFFDKVSLFSIVAAIGSPLQVDAATANLVRPSVARICIDLDISRDLPSRIWIGTGSNGRQGHCNTDCRQSRRGNRGRPVGGGDARAMEAQALEGRSAAAAQPREAVLQPAPLPGLLLSADAAPVGAAMPALLIQEGVVTENPSDMGQSRRGNRGRPVEGGDARAMEARALEGRSAAATQSREAPAPLPGLLLTADAASVGAAMPALHIQEGVVVTENPSALGKICDDAQLHLGEQEKVPSQGSLSDGEDQPGRIAPDKAALVASFQQFSLALGSRLPTQVAVCDESGFTMVLPQKSRKRRVYNAIPRQILTRQASKAIEELPFSGSTYTWSGVRAGARIWKRLDRVLVNQHWLDFLPNTSVQHLNRATSDHSPLLVSLRPAAPSFPKSFKFQSFWVSSPGLLPLVQSNWDLATQGYGMYRLAFKLKRLKTCLRQWSREHFGDIFQAVRQHEVEVQQKEVIYEANQTEETRAELHRAQGRLLHSLRIQEDYWRQKARLRWVTDGDSNTRYFHAFVREKRSKLAIHRIQDADGTWLEGDDRVGEEAVRFFQQLLTAEEIRDVEDLLAHIPELVSAAQNGELMREVTMEEVKGVVFDLDKDSAPGVDGYTGVFFRHFWDTVALDVLAATRDFLAGTPIPKGIASTLIVLIPKRPNPTTFADFRPISLCTFVNKVFTKVLANRLRAFLPGFISPEQSAFCPGRDIAENVLLAQEMIASINKKTLGHNYIFKLDMMKAFDRVSWEFLHRLLQKFGFGYRFILLILNNLS